MLEEDDDVEVKEAVDFLLCNEDDDGTLLRQSLTTLYVFLHNWNSSAGTKAALDQNDLEKDECFLLRRQRSGGDETTATTSSIRDVLSPFGVNGDREWQQLTQRLAVGMERRVDNDSLLPLTQDVDANNEAMKENSARTLTQTSLAAATVYAQLLATNGALAVGLVEMNAVSALSNVLRRWKFEVCSWNGNELNEIKNNKSKNEKKKKTTNLRRKKGRYDYDDSELHENFSDDDDYNDEDVQPLKRIRKSDSSEDSDDDEGADTTTFRQGAASVAEHDDEDAFSSPQQLVSVGLALARELCKIPLQKEFSSSWKMEAVEVVLDSVALAMAAAQALTAGRKNNDLLALAVVEQASDALRRCMIAHDESCDLSEEEESPIVSLQKRHDTVVVILRGLYPTISMKDVLPNGEAGKLAAAGAASQALECLIQGINEDIALYPHRWPKPCQEHHCSNITSVAPSTPSNATSSSASMPVTPKTSQKKSRTGSLTGKTRRASVTPKFKPKTLAPMTTLDQAPKRTNTRPRMVISAVIGMLQQLATAKGLEKASVRTPTVDTLQRCVKHLPLAERAYYLSFLVRLTHSKVSVHRLVAAELIGWFLSEDWLWSEHGNSNSTVSEFLQLRTPGSTRGKSFSPLVTNNATSVPLALFGALQGRLLDRAPTIRTTSAVSLTNVFRRLLEAKIDVAGMVTALAEEADALVECLRRRAVGDDKATVRRAACSALVELLVIGESSAAFHCPISEYDVFILSQVCQDSSTMTRRAAAEGLTRLLECVVVTGNEKSMTDLLERTWTASTLTMVLDTETGCATKAVELVERVVIFPILAEDDGRSDRDKRTAWRILATIGDGVANGASRSEAEALRVFLQKSIAAASSDSYAASIFRKIHCVATKSLDGSYADLFAPDVDFQRTGVWCLFDAAMGHTKDQAEITRIIKRSKIDVDFLGTAWDTFIYLFLAIETPDNAKSALQRSMRNCLRVLSQLAFVVDADLAEKTVNNLQALISDFSLPPEIIGSAITALAATTLAAKKKESEQSQHERLAIGLRALYKVCENKIAAFIPDHRHEVAALTRVLYTAGELSMVGFSSNDDNDGSTDNQTNQGNTSMLDFGFCERPSKQLVSYIQAFMTNNLPGRDDILTPESVRAHAFVAFGKLCLRDSVLAKKSLNILARELHDSIDQGNWMVQSNSLLVLGDLCVKYTNMVDRFLPVMAGCLQAGVTDLCANALTSSPQNGSALVRKHAILLLSSLLLQDYIKWRGLLFHRFLVASVDEDDDVAVLAELVLYGPLIARQPRLFSNQFVEALFVLNRCTAHPIYQAAAAMGDGGSGISVGFDGINLTGEAGRIRRMRMYQKMLSKMSDEDKIGVTARIGKEVLGGALKIGSELNVICGTTTNEHSSAAYDGAFNVLSDAFAILTCPLIRVGKNNRNEENDIDDPNVTANNAKLVLVAKGRLLSNVSRKHLIEILLPILCNLKSILEKSRSPLLKDLRVCLLDVYQRYKAEAQECLANDPTTLQEIEYDAQQLKKAQRGPKTPSRSKTSIVVANAALTSKIQSPAIVGADN